MMRFCDKCKTKYPYGEECPNGCKRKEEKRRQKHYDTHNRNRERSMFYKSRAWRSIRLQVLSRYNSLCLWSWGNGNRIIQATTVHHIIELKADNSLRLEQSNLIPLSAKAHMDIHKLYNDGYMANTQEELRKLKNKWENLMG